MRLVVIKWTDAECQESRWNEADETLEELKEDIQPCFTAGFVIKETPQFIAVTLTDGGHCWGPFIQIPKSCILDMKSWDFSWGEKNG